MRHIRFFSVFGLVGEGRQISLGARAREGSAFGALQIRGKFWRPTQLYLIVDQRTSNSPHLPCGLQLFLKLAEPIVRFPMHAFGLWRKGIVPKALIRRRGRTGQPM
jgi:hypothetical protein